MDNKNIELCGIGNGLVDIQIEVPDNIISEFKLSKGGMQLAETAQQADLIKNLSQFKQHKSSGGSAANTIIAFSQFGGKAAYKTVLGNDEFGNFYAKEFTDLGIELPAKIESSQPTGTCLVLITPDTERTMVTALGASALFKKEDLNEDMIKRSKWLYIEGYEFTQEDSAHAVMEAVELAKKHNTKIALTFSDTFITELFKDNLKFVADKSDLIFCNEAEAMNYTKAETFEGAIHQFGKSFKNYAITRGSEGSVVSWNGLVYDIKSYPATPKDSTGAGDMYAGGFLYGIISTGNPRKAGHLGSAAAAKVVSQLGARLQEDHQALRDKIFTEVE